MHRSPSTAALAAAVAVLALAAAAGALGGAALGDGLAIDDDSTVPPERAGQSGEAPVEPNRPAGSGGTDCGLSCSLPTARSLLGALAVPLSPTLLAGGAVVVGLLLVASRRGTPGETATTDTDGVDSVDGVGGAAAATPSDPGYDAPEETTVVAAFRWLRTAAAEAGGGDDTAVDSLTPREVRRAAVEAGYDPAAVATVVGAFEAVRYGGEGAATREQAVAEALGTLDPEVSVA